MNSYTIIQIVGFYLISSIGIYKFILTCDMNTPTVAKSIIILIAIPYYPLMYLYNKIKTINRKYKKRKYIKQIQNEIEILEYKIKLETDKEELDKLYEIRSELEDELYLLNIL